MNAGLAHTIESLFGPPSERINLSDFIDSSSDLFQETAVDHEMFPDDIVEECSVSDIHAPLRNTWSNPTLSAYIIRDHDYMVSALHAMNSTVNQKPQKSSKKLHLPDPDKLSFEVTNLQKSLDAVSLNSFRLKTDAILFMRTPKNSDKNILQNVKAKSESSLMAQSPEAVLTISIHNKLTWGPSYVARSSQHVFLSSQTIQDVYDAIRCESKNLPPEAGIPKAGSGCVICIEGLAYGSGTNNNDYAVKLLELLDSLPKKNSNPVIIAPTSQKDTKLRSLSLRISEPYWLIHHGNCEHFVVIDQIRLLHPSDPRSSYPLTLQITPPILDLCRACTKVPAALSVVGDVRLGESPCVLCGPCWKNMGESKDGGVTVLPLTEPSYL